MRPPEARNGIYLKIGMSHRPPGLETFPPFWKTGVDATPPPRPRRQMGRIVKSGIASTPAPQQGETFFAARYRFLVGVGWCGPSF